MCLGHGLLELTKSFGSGFGLNKGSLFEAICDRGGDGAKASNEPPIECGKSMKTLDFMEVFGFWQI